METWTPLVFILICSKELSYSENIARTGLEVAEFAGFKEVENSKTKAKYL